MKKVIILLFIVISFVYSANNWSGGLDTSSILDFDSIRTKYSKVFSLTDGEDIRAIVQVDDTTSAGYASDSVAIAWGYQTGSIIGDGSGGLDTIYDVPIVLDTILTANFGQNTAGTSGTDGLPVRVFKNVDTTSTTGARQTHWFLPEWDVVIRYFFTGYAGNKVGEELELKIIQLRRVGVETEEK